MFRNNKYAQNTRLIMRAIQRASDRKRSDNKRKIMQANTFARKKPAFILRMLMDSLVAHKNTPL